MNPPLRALAGSSGDLIADRRYAWGEAAARDGDFAAAAELFGQTLELAPDWAAAWLALGEARRRRGDLAGAREAFACADTLDPQGELGAALRLAALGADPPASAPRAYVRDLFDQYAARFDDHLVGALAYRGPALLRAAVERAAPRRFSRMLDLGCGTGLAAREFAAMAERIDGVDLAPAMIEQARRTGLYELLEAADLTTFLDARSPAGADLVIAADVFVYLGDLAPVFAACARAMATGGIFAFTTQFAEDRDWRVGADLRYAHRPAYLRRLAAGAGFDVMSIDSASTRRDAGADVPGLVCALRRR